MDRGEDGHRRGPNTRIRAGGRASPHRLPVRSLAGKLQLTRIALGCSTQKELVARFAAVNPATAFTAQNAYKWLSGKAMPRVSSVYEDWAQILGGRLAAPFIAACSFEEFARALRGHFDIPEAALSALRAETEGPGAAAGDAASGSPAGHLASGDGNGASPVAPVPRSGWEGFGRRDTGRGAQLLEGTYLGLSLAWSRAQQGRAILGAARIQTRGENGPTIDYVERVLGRSVPFAGLVTADNHTVQSVMECLPTGRLYLLALQFPVFPANVVGGLLCGTVVHDPETRSMASRMLFVRNHALDWDALVARAGYADLDTGTLSRELAALGYGGGPSAAEAVSRIAAFLRPGEGHAVEVGAPDIGELGHALDLVSIDPQG